MSPAYRPAQGRSGTATYVRAGSLDGLKEVAAEAGQDIGPMLERFGLPFRAVNAKEVELPFDPVCDLLEACAEEWDMPDLGVRMSRYQALETFGVIALVVRMERTTRAALLAIMRNFVIHSDAILADLEEQMDTAAIVLSFRRRGGSMRQFNNLALCVAKVLTEVVTELPVTPLQVTTIDSDAGREDGLGGTLRCPVAYGSERCALYLDRALMETPISFTDVAFHPIIRKYLAEANAKAEGRFDETVRLEVLRQLSAGRCSQDQVASALRVGVRAMQRRLSGSGTSFRTILDEERRRRMLSLVQQTRMPLSEVALASGYSDQTAFNQAFRRSFGTTPLRIRRGERALPHQ